MYSRNMLFSYGNAAEDLADDEIDELFNHLEQFEPPASLVASIMTTVSQLPPHSQWSALTPDESDIVIVHGDHAH
ncbi:MAG TPA: hypothetical protein VL485_13300 [Ktedonobacteraceae bacterium]|nr:hypothetical protein [Ktedonobacteraceae bacterium]